MPVNEQSPLSIPGDDAPKAPVYRRIQRHILDRITSGELGVGDRLPTEMEIARQFGTSRATVQSAMSRLVYEGWIDKQAGRGTFVASAGHMATIDLHYVRSFEEDVARTGGRVTYRLVSVGRTQASEEVAERLGVDEGATIFTFQRLRLVGGSIIGLERRFFAPEITLGMPLDALDTISTHDLVEHHIGRRIGRMEVSIRAAAADARLAEKLTVPPRSPLLLRRHTMFSAEDEVILFGEAYYREPFAFRYMARTERDV